MKRGSSILGVLILISTMVLLLSACRGGESGSGDTGTGDMGTGDSTSGGSTTETGNGNSETTQPVAASPTPEDILPEVLVLHPDAFDFDFSESSGTYIYYVPMMAQETIDYLLAEHEAKGWEKLGNPTVMGNIATLIMKMEDSRLTVSMQYNELSESTRVQMLLVQ